MSAAEAKGAGAGGRDAARWLRYAREDLGTARGILELGMSPPRHACWLAQQAAEKFLKALLAVLGTDFPRTHDLDLLRVLLPPDSSARSRPHDVSELSEWAVESRYPGDWPEPTNEDAAKAIEIADGVASAVADDLTALGWTDPAAHD